jgi:MATE family multidrug resistance protein
MTEKQTGTWTDELRELLVLAWPAVLGQLGLMAMGVVDAMLAGRVGKRELAAIALGHTWTFGVSIVAMGTIGGLDPLLSQSFGAGDRRAAGSFFVRGLALAALLSVPTALLHGLAGPGLRLLGEPEALIPLAAQYCQWLIPSLPFLLWFGLVRQFLQAAGRMRPVAVAIGFGNVVNLVLGWSLLFGRLGMPKIGLPGLAISTMGSRIAMFVVLCWLGWDLFQACIPDLRVELRDVHRGTLGRMLRMGLPVGLQVGMEVWAFTGTTLLMGRLGETAIAAHMVTLNLASLSFMVPFGVSAAAATRVGNQLGAGQDWTRAASIAIALGCAAMSCSAAIFATFPQALAEAYAPTEPAVVVIAASLLPIAACFQLFDGIQAVSFGVLRGAGDTRVPWIANLIGYWIVGLPLGSWLAFRADWGARGLWVGLSLGLFIVAMLLLMRVRVTMARGGFRVSG